MTAFEPDHRADDERMTVVLVDDEASFLSLVSDYLAAELDSPRVETFTDPLDALERIEESPPDCVVSDYSMGAVDGIEFLERLRADHPELPFIMVTGYGSEEVASEAIGAGATDYVSKSTVVDHRELLTNAIENAVSEVRSRRELRAEREFVTDALNALDDVFYVLDLDGRLRRWNDRVNEITGRDDDSLAGARPTEFIAPEHHDRVEAGIERVISAGRAVIEVDFLGEDGERTPFEVTGSLLRDEDGPYAICGVGRDITERRRRTAELRRSDRQLRAIAADPRTFVELLSPDGTVEQVNDPALAFLDRPEAAVVGTPFWDLPWWGPGAVDEAYLRDAVDRVADGDIVRFETLLVGPGERSVAVDLSLRPVTDETGEVVTLIAESIDTTERQEREATLRSLNEASRRLLEAEYPAEIATVAVEAGAAIGDGIAWLYRWDDDTGELTPRAREPADGVDLPVVRGGDSAVWNAFVEGEVSVVSDPEVAVVPGTGYRTDGAVLAPLGTYGVLVVCWADGAGFDDPDVGATEMLAASTQSALERTERERALHEKEHQLERRNEELTRLGRINDVIRTVDKGLVRAETSEGVQQVVCERLTAEEGYAFAWICRREGDELVAAAHAGDGARYLDRLLSGSADGPTPVERAIETDEPVRLDNVLTDTPVEGLRRTALEQGFRAAVTIPLTHEGTTYGALEVFSVHPGVFAGEEGDVLVELGDTVAYALHTVGRTEARLSGGGVRLELRAGGDDVLVRLADRADCRLTVEQVIQEGGGWLVYVTVDGADASRFQALAEQFVSVESSRAIRERADGGRFELRTADLGLAGFAASHGGRLHSLTVTPADQRLVVDLPQAVGVRSFVDAVGERYPDVELVARRERSTEGGPTSAGSSWLSEDLTPRQREALLSAYHAGFFEWPRDSTGEEVAEAIGVSAPTFHSHLRKSLRKLLEASVE